MVQGDSREEETGREDCLHEGYYETPVHHELRQSSTPLVAVPPVHQKEATHVTKLKRELEFNLLLNSRTKTARREKLNYGGEPWIMYIHSNI